MPPATTDLFRLDGRVAVIIGGARNLGRDMAEALADGGCHVLLTSRDAQDAQQAADEITSQSGVEARGVALDVRTWESVAALADQAFAWKSRVDILINNAGGGSGKSVAHLFERDPRDIADLIHLNLTAPLLTCKAFAPAMAKQASGSIINIASIAGLLGRDRRMYERSNMLGQPIDYAAAKAGVLGMTRDLAGLLSPMGIRVNAISPGGFGPRELPETFVKDYSDRTPLGHMGRDGLDLKGAALFLASDASAYVTGQNLVVDGGFSIWH